MHMAANATSMICKNSSGEYIAVTIESAKVKATLQELVKSDQCQYGLLYYPPSLLLCDRRDKKWYTIPLPPGNGIINHKALVKLGSAIYFTGYTRSKNNCWYRKAGLCRLYLLDLPLKVELLAQLTLEGPSLDCTLCNVSNKYIYLISNVHALRYNLNTGKVYTVPNLPCYIDYVTQAIVYQERYILLLHRICIIKEKRKVTHVIQLDTLEESAGWGIRDDLSEFFQIPYQVYMLAFGSSQSILFIGDALSINEYWQNQETKFTMVKYKKNVSPAKTWLGVCIPMYKHGYILFHDWNRTDLLSFSYISHELQLIDVRKEYKKYIVKVNKSE
eukprot:TRINITY_DN1858_c0_g1_i2.p1 TRINITY_DN1858_c0_g1~~TRINITY_DN1858_c0_g1_i2.p1  ORF type:complete len:331 (+),score=7.95 TRINITY_DN1858_c0_g1_i2:433-1425(+)